MIPRSHPHAGVEQSGTDPQEAALARALAVLRDTPTPSGMEQRIRQRLAQLPEHRSSTVPWTWLVSALAAALVVAASLRTLHPPLQQSYRQADAHEPRTAGTRPPPKPLTEPPCCRLPQPVHANRNTVATSARLASATVGVKRETPAEVDPAFLPSMPAPVHPLTPDERTLIRMARHEHGYLLAQLNIPEPHPADRYYRPEMPPLLAGFTQERPTPAATPQADSPTNAPEVLDTTTTLDTPEPK